MGVSGDLSKINALRMITQIDSSVVELIFHENINKLIIRDPHILEAY